MNERDRTRTVDMCQSLPRMPVPMIQRDNMLNTVERVLASDVELLVVEGEEGIGKTTLLAQFALRHPWNVFAAFVKSGTRFGYEPGTLRYDLCCQLSTLLRPKDPCDPESATEGYLHRLLLSLRRYLRGQRYYFIIDGLSEVEDPTIRSAILDLFPVGQGFPVLLGGDQSTVPSQVLKSVRVRSVPVVNFSLDETTKYLQDLCLDPPLVRELHHACGNGVPGHLASVRRSVQAGADPNRLAKQRVTDLFEEEWNRAAMDDWTAKVISVIAHAQHRFRTADLSRILECEEAEVGETLGKLSFLTVDDDSGEVNFVSTSFAQFAAETLRDRRDEARDLIIKDLLNRPQTPQAMENLPSYLSQSGRLEEVLTCLSPEYFSRIVQLKQSLVPVHQKVDLGVSTSVRLRHDGPLVQFCIQKSAITQMEQSQLWRSEVEALMAIKEYEKALNLAENAPLKEDRLHLLAVIAKSQKEQGVPVDDGLLGQIKMLYSQVDPTYLGERAIDIAADLFYSCSDLAVNLIERVAWTDGGENALDLAYTKLSIAASRSRPSTSESGDKLEAIRKRIRNPRLKGFTSSVASIAQSAREVIAEVQVLDTASDRLHLLRYWAQENPQREDAVEVVDYSLQQLIGSTPYAPNARVLREIATPMPFVRNVDRSRELVGVFDSQRIAIEESGPTEDVVRLQLLLARTENKYDVAACRNRLVEMYLYVSKIGDLATKASCLAWLLSCLRDVDPTGEMDAKEQIGALSSVDLAECIDSLLGDTAGHYHIARNIIQALVSTDQPGAFKVATSLNTQDRRDRALLVYIDSVLDLTIDVISFDLVRKAIDAYVDFRARDEAAVRLTDYLSGQDVEIEEAIRQLLPFLDVIYRIEEPVQRCRALCLAHSLLSRGGGTHQYESLRSGILSRVDQTWDDTDIGWERIDTGFRVVKAFAGYSPELARQYLSRTEEVRETTQFKAFSTEWTFQASIRLAIRAFAGQLPGHHDKEEDFERLKRLIERVSGLSNRAELWTELALEYFIHRRSDQGKLVVNQYLRPLVDSIPLDNRAARIDAVVSAAPALYCTHSAAAKHEFDKLPQPYRDFAYSECADFINRKCIPSDPYEDHDLGYSVDFSEMNDLLDIVESLEVDNAIFRVAIAVADTLSANKSRDRFTPQQRSHIVRRLENAISSRLPDNRNIKHDGYKIASRAHLLRIGSTGSGEWEALVEAARSIPNKADRAFVVAIIGKALPSRQREKKRRLFQEAIDGISEIPCTLDRIDRLADLASMLVDNHPDIARDCLKQAASALSDSERYGDYSAHRRIIDTAFRIDKDFAASLVSISDNDPARDYARVEMKRRLRMLQGKKAFIDDPSSCAQIAAKHRLELPNSAWMALGALNAGRASTLHLENTRQPLQLAATYPLGQSYPILSWVVQNAVERLAETEQSTTILRQRFEATILAAEIAERMGLSISDRILSARLTPTSQRDAQTILIGTGERDKAVRTLREWLHREVRDYVKICDQYFGPGDLDLLMMIQSAHPGCDIRVLTSKKHHNQKVMGPVDEEYANSWRRLCDQRPPKVEVVIVGMESSGKSPLHDRIWLTEGAGLKMGTSWNSIGRTQESTITMLSGTDAGFLENEIDQYLLDKKRDFGNERLRYQVITL